VRDVTEFAPRNEVMLSVAVAEDSALWAGSSHGIYRFAAEGGLRRYPIPCRHGDLPAKQVGALAARGVGVVAVLQWSGQDGEPQPGGLLELDLDGAHRCHVAGIDVPEAMSLSVAATDDSIWLASYAGPTQIRGLEAELFDRASGAPEHPVTAVAVGPRDTQWFGTWGGGVYRLEGRRGRRHDFGAEAVGRTVVEEFELR
jgi:hypothetical protein